MSQSPHDSTGSISSSDPSPDTSNLGSEPIHTLVPQLEYQEYTHSRSSSISQTVSDQLLEEWEAYLKEDSEDTKLVKLKSFLQCFLSLYSIQPTLALSSFPGDLSFVCTLLAKELISLLNQIKLDIYKEPESHSASNKRVAKSCDKLECLSNDFGFLLLHTLNILCGQVCPGHVELPLKILLILKQIVPNLDLSTQHSLLFDSIDKSNLVNSSLLSIHELSSRNLKVRQTLYDPFLIERSGMSEHISNDVLLKQWSESTNSPSRELEFFYDKIIALRAKSSVEIVILLLSLFENLVQTESIIGNAMKLHVCLVHGLLDVHKKICEKQNSLTNDCKDDNQNVSMLFLRLSLRVSFSEMLLVSNHPEVLTLFLKSARLATFSFLKHTLQLPTQTHDLGVKIVLSEALNGTLLTNRMIVAKLSSLGIRYRSALMDFLGFLDENLFPIISSVISKIDDNFQQQFSLASLTYKLFISSVNSATQSLIEFLDELFLISEEATNANKFASLLINLITSGDLTWMTLHLLHSLRNSKTDPEIIHNFSFTPFIESLAKYHDDANLQSQMLDIIENTLIRISDNEERQQTQIPQRKKSSHSWGFLEVYGQMLSPVNPWSERLAGHQERKALLTHLARLLHLGGFQLRRTIVFQVLFPLLISIDDCINSDANSLSTTEIKDEAIRLLELVSSSLQLLSKGSHLRDHGQGEFFFEQGEEKKLYENYLEILFGWIGNHNELRKAVIKSLKCVCMRESRQYFTDRFSFTKESGSVNVSAHPLNDESTPVRNDSSIDPFGDLEDTSFHKIPLKNGTFLFGLILGLSCIPDPTDTTFSTELWRFAHENFKLKLNSSTVLKLSLSEIYLSPSFEDINKDLPAIISRLELHRDLWRALTEILSHQHHSSSFLAQWIVSNRLDDILVTCAHSLGKFMKRINEYLKFNPNSKSKPSLLNVCSILISMFTYVISIKGLCCVVSKQNERSDSKNLQSLKRLIDSLNGDCLKEIDFFKYPTGKYYVYTLMSLSTLTLVNPYKMNKKTQVIDYFATDHHPATSSIQLGHLFTNSIREDFQNQTTTDSRDMGYVAEIEDYLSPDLSFSVKKKQIQPSSPVKPIIYFPEAVRRVFALFELSLSPSNLTREVLKDALPTFELLLDIIKSPYNLHVIHFLEIFTKLINMCGHILVDDEAIANSDSALMITRILKILGKYSITAIQLKKLLLLFHKAKYSHKIAEILAYISDFSKEALIPPCYFIPFPLTSLRLDQIPDANFKTDTLAKKSNSIRLPKTEHKLQSGATFSLWLSVSPDLQSIPLFNIELTESFYLETHRLLITATEHSRNIKIIPVTIKQAKSGKVIVGTDESLEFENILKPGIWQNLVLSIWYDKEPRDPRGVKVSLLLYIDGVSAFVVKDIRFPDPHPMNCLALWSVLIGGENSDVRGVLAGVGSTNWKFCSLVVYRAILGSREVVHIHNRGPHIINPYGLFNAQTIKNGELPGFLFAYSAFEHCTLLLSRQKPLGDSPLNDAIEFKMIDDQSRLIQPQILSHLPDMLHCWGGISALLYLVAMLVRDGGPDNEYPVSLVLQTIKSCCEYHAFTKESMEQIDGIILLSRVFETKLAPVGELILEVFLSWCKDYNGRICSPEILQHILLNWRIWNRCQSVWEVLLKKLTNFLTVEGNLQVFQKTDTLHRLLFSLQERSLDKSLVPLSVEVANQYLVLIRGLVEQQFNDKKMFQRNLRLITEFFFVSQIHPDPVLESIRVPSEEISKLLNTTSRFISTKISPSAFCEIQTPESSLFSNNPIINAARSISPETDANPGLLLPDSLQPFHPMNQSADLYSSLTNSVNIRIELEILNLIFSVLVNTPDSLSHTFFEYDTPLKPQVLLHDSCMYTVCHRTKVIETLRILYCRVQDIHRNRFLEMRGFHVLGVKLSKHSVSRELVEACFQWISPAIKLNLAGELGLTDRTINIFNLHAAVLIFYVIDSCAIVCTKTCHQSLLLLMKLFQDIPNFANLVYKEHLLENIYTFAFHLRATMKFNEISEDDKNLLLKDIKTFFQIICFYSIISPSLFCMLENFLTFFHSYEIKCMNKPEYKTGLQFSRVVQYLALQESFMIILNMDTTKIVPPLSIGKMVDQDDLCKRFKELVSRALGIVLFTRPVFTDDNSTFYPPSSGTTSYNLIEQSEEFSMLEGSITTVMCEVNFTREDIQNIDWLFASLLLLKLSEILLSLRRELYIKYDSAKKYRHFTDKHNHLSQFFKLFSFLLHTTRPKPLRSYTIWCMLHHKTCRSLVKEIAGDEKGSPFYECKDMREKFLIRLVYKASELFHFMGVDTRFFPPEKSNDVSEFFDRILERKQKSYLPRSFNKLAEIWDKNIKSEYSKLSDTDNIWQKEENEARTFWNQDMDNNRATVIESWRKDRKATQESMTEIDDEAHELHLAIKGLALDNLRRWHTHVLGCLHGWRFLIQNMMHDRSLWFRDDTRHKIWGLDPTEGPNRIRLRLMQMPCDIEPKHFNGKKEFSTQTKHPMIYLFLDLPEHLKDIQLNEKPPEEEIILGRPCSSISQDLRRNGTLIITSKELFFFSDQPLKEISHTKLLPYDNECTGVSWKIADLAHIYQRLCKLQDVALEFCMNNGHTLFLEFENKKSRDEVYDRILHQHPGRLKNNMNTKLKDRVEECIARWRQGGSNFQLIMDLNQLAGRTYNDLMQYPVFPFVLNDYTSTELKLNNPKTFRDLSLPLPAQLEEGRNKLMDNYNETEHELMYTSLYSNTPSVLYFLIRIPPFTQQFLVFQGDKFDLADRCFHDMRTVWKQNTEPGSKSFKELIPEFFYFPEIFINRADLKLGTRQCRTSVANVVLPSWATDPRMFVLKHRQALESNHVSKNIHKWLDLIFGYKQRDEEAVSAFNVFDPRLYSFVNNPGVDRDVHLKMLEHTGQVPKQLLPYRPFPSKDYSQTRIAIGILPPGMSSSTRKPPVIAFINNIIPTIGVVLTIGYESDYFIGLNQSSCQDLEIKESQSYKREKAGPITQLNYCDSDLALIAVSDNTCVSLRSKQSQAESQGAVGILKWGFWDNHIEVREVKEKSSSGCYVYGHPLEKITICKFIDNETFVTGSSLGVVTYWRNKRDEKDSIIAAKPYYLHGHSEPITSLAICIPFSIMVSGSGDRSIIVWDINRIAFVRYISTPKEAGGVTCIAISHTLGDIAVACESGGGGSSLCIWTINGQFIKQLNFKEGITCIQYTAALEGVYVNVLATGHQDGCVRFLSSWNLSIFRDLNTHVKNPITAITFGPNHKEIIIGTANGQIGLWVLQPKSH